MWFTALIQTHFNWNQSHLNKFAISSFKWICFHKEKAYKMYTIKWAHQFHPTDTHSHTQASFSPLSQSCLQRNRCNYWVLRLWLLQARPWGSNISTSIPFLSSFLTTQASFILLYRSCLDHIEGLRLGVKLYQLNDRPFSTSYISHGIKGNPRCVKGADTHSHLHTHVGWQSGPYRSECSGSQYTVPLGEGN